MNNMQKLRGSEDMFSNGTEYMMWLEENCCQCKKYVTFEEATKENTVCHVEDAIAVYACTEENWPEEVKKNGIYVGKCEKFEKSEEEE